MMILKKPPKQTLMKQQSGLREYQTSIDLIML